VILGGGTNVATREETSMSTTTTEITWRRARTKVACIVLGHRWKRDRRPDRTVLLTCRRCGHMDVVEKDLDFGPFFGGAG